MTRVSRRTAPTLLVVVATALISAGCASTAAAPASTTPPTSAAATTAPPTGGAFAATCDELVPASELASLASGFAASTSYTPKVGSYPAEIISFGGVACEWTTAAGDTLTVAAAKPTHDQLTTAETAIGNSGTASTLFGSDVKAWTPAGGGTFPGDFEVFPGGTYWVSMTSSLFTTPDSAQAKTVYSAIAQALPSG